MLDGAFFRGFDVLITVDQNIPNQQNLTERRLSILILRAKTNRLRDLMGLVALAKEALKSIGYGNVVLIP